MQTGMVALIRIIVFLALVLANPAQAACRHALVLALDVSSSVDAREYALQMQGVATALDDPRVRQALLGNGSGHVALMIYEWSGRHQQVDILPWLEITRPADIDTAIATLRAHPRSHANYPTALGFAMGYGAIQLDRAPNCTGKTLDVSGDGINNEGYRPRLAIPNFNFENVTVNGLVIGGADTLALTDYYRQEVIYGVGSFVEVATDYEDYARAIRRKLLRELTVLALSRLEP